MRRKELLALLTGVLLLVGCREPSDDPVFTTEAVSGDNEYVPSVELQTLVSSLRDLGMSAKDAAKMAKFFNDFADVLRRDDSIIKTTADIREGYIRAETLMLQKTAMVGRYPGFGEAKDDILAETIGLDNVPLNAEKRLKAVQAFEAMAWALGG
jgi:hypothetical protein